jgi:RNA polymerase sigma factor (sigma-70 family)
MTRKNYLFRRLKRYLRLRGESEEDAEDQIQDAWLRMLEYSKKIEVQDVEAFLKQTVKNLAIDQYRHRIRYPYADGDIEQLEQTLPLVHPGPAPDEVLEVDQRLIEMRDRLNALRKWTGDIFMAHRSGFTYSEIAADFGLSESAIEKRIALAVLWLMEQRELR